MDKKHAGITAVILAILLALVYSQFRMWKNFDWSLFLAQTHSVSKFHILHGIALIYLAYVLRAVRWKIFLRPLRPQASTTSLVAPTVIGFTGLALLGRPGELIRPYLIAKGESLTFSSQMAVWTVERIFDIGAFAILLVVAVFWPGTTVHAVHDYVSVRVFGLLFLALVAGLSLMAIVIARNGEAVSSWIEHRFSHLAADLGHRIAQRLRE